jgi:D-alanine-D-alanine ligase
MSRKLTVAVIFGGQSGEHEVSLASASSVIQALDRDKYRVIPLGISKKGRWITGGDPMARLRSASHADTAEEPIELISEREGTGTNTSTEGKSTGESSRPAADIPSNELQLIPMERLRDTEIQDAEIDVAFPVLHGPYGEDGTIQGLLEIAGIPYVGAGVLASAVGMDKEMMKTLFEHRGLPSVRYITFTRKLCESDLGEVMGRVEAEIGYPAFVKPCNMGSSVGISKAKGPGQLKEAIELACRHDRKIIVEEGLDCREIECSVLGNDEPQVSLAGEIVSKHEFYDYEAKYTEGLADIVIPAPIDDALMKKARKLALEAYRAIHCSGMARVDLFLERESNALYLNEINTIPGFTATSVYTKLWEATGIGYSQLLDKLIELALERHRENRRILDHSNSD